MCHWSLSCASIHISLPHNRALPSIAFLASMSILLHLSSVKQLTGIIVSASTGHESLPENPTSNIQRRTTFQDPDAPNQPHRRETGLARVTSRISSIRRTMTENLTPDKKLGEPPSLFQSIKAIITASCTQHRSRSVSFHVRLTSALTGLNLLLACIPVSVCPTILCSTIWTYVVIVGITLCPP